MFGEILSGIGALAGGAGGLASAAAAKREAERNREWQERMSNTAVQRRTEDLRKAGMNPILAATNGALQAASQPSGSVADTSGYAHAAQGVSSASQAITAYKAQKTANQQMLSNLQLQAAQTASSAADVRVKDAQVRNMDVQNSNLQSQNNLINQQVLTEAARRSNLEANTGLSSAQSLRTQYQSMQDKVIRDYLLTPAGQTSTRNIYDSRASNGLGIPNFIGSVLNRYLYGSPNNNSSGNQSSARGITEGWSLMKNPLWNITPRRHSNGKEQKK